MRIDLHNHTPLCNHAIGSPQDYIAKARNLGIDVYGFSCHAPMEFDKKYRMSKGDIPRYLDEINALRWQNKDIEILLGFEVDFIKGHEELIESCVIESDVDYLIGSVHFLDDWGFDNPEFISEYAKRDVAKCWELYLDSIKAMARSGLFDIVGHLDLFKLFGFEMPSFLESKLDSTLKVIADSQMCLEINSAGLRKKIKEPYPSLAVLQKAFKLGIPITFGSDAHSVEQVGFGCDECVKLAKQAGYTTAQIYRKKKPISVEF